MRIYQPKESEQWIPHNLYMSIVYQIRDYERQKAEYGSYLETIGSIKGKRPTEKTAIVMEKMGRNITAIDRALETLAPEYRNGVWENVMRGTPYPDGATRTWSRQKCKFIRQTGINFGWINE